MAASIVIQGGTTDWNTGNAPKQIEIAYEKLSVAYLDIIILFPQNDLKIESWTLPKSPLCSENGLKCKNFNKIAQKCTKI